MKISHRAKFIFAWGTILVAYLCMFIVLFWLLYPYRTISFLDHNYPTDQKEVYQGDSVSYSVRYCKYTDKKPTLKREFVDGIIYEIEPIAPFIAKGCGTQKIVIDIPEALPAGKYRIRVTIIYKLNPLRSIEKVIETDWFIVKDIINPARNIQI